MARPRKTGLDYFPFDCDFFSDEKLVAIAGEFGAKGEIVTVKLLCAIYRNGYFIEWSEMMRYKMLSQVQGVSVEMLDSIVRRLVRWGFFDKELFDRAGVLTSRGIQQRYFEASKFRKLGDDLPYLLEKPKVNYANKEVSQELTAVSHEKMPEIKRKENKLKKYPPTSDMKKPAAGAASGEEEGDVFGDDLPPADVRMIRMALTKCVANSEKLAKEMATDAETVMKLANEVADRWMMTGEFSRTHPVSHMMRTIGCKLEDRKSPPPDTESKKRAVEADIEEERRRQREEERRHASEVVSASDYLKSRGLKPDANMAELARQGSEPTEDGELPPDVRDALDAINDL